VRLPSVPPPVAVRRSRIQGRGVYSTRSIAEGERVIEYTGARLSHREADARYPDDEDTDRHHTFLFAVDGRTAIDGNEGGNDARFINHSCDPNCEVEIEEKRVFIDALRGIAAGEELTYDYWYVTDERYSLADLRRIYPCRCGAASCRGTLARPPRRRPKRAKKTARQAAKTGAPVRGTSRTSPPGGAKSRTPAKRPSVRPERGP
jgi:SET domain-containing protein